MTNQEVFDTVCEHLAKQGRRARDGSPQNYCCYRAPDGAKCAVGCLIPDDLYEVEMDGSGYSVAPLLDHFPKFRKLFEGVDEYLLMRLQIAHDRSENLSDLHVNLIDTAERLQLSADKVALIERWS